MNEKTKNRGVEKERDGEKGWKEMERKGRESGRETLVTG